MTPPKRRALGITLLTALAVLTVGGCAYLWIYQPPPWPTAGTAAPKERP